MTPAPRRDHGPTAGPTSTTGDELGVCVPVADGVREGLIVLDCVCDGVWVGVKEIVGVCDGVADCEDEKERVGVCDDVKETVGVCDDVKETVGVTEGEVVGGESTPPPWSDAAKVPLEPCSIRATLTPTTAPTMSSRMPAPMTLLRPHRPAGGAAGAGAAAATGDAAVTAMGESPGTCSCPESVARRRSVPGRRGGGGQVGEMVFRVSKFTWDRCPPLD